MHGPNATRISSAAERIHAERGRAREFRGALHASQVPMITVDNERRLLDGNLAAKLLLRLTTLELRRRNLDELTRHVDLSRLESLWGQLLSRGQLWGTHEFWVDGNPGLNVAFLGLANVLPGEHVLVLAPADWPADELGPAEERTNTPVATQLSRRQREVLGLIADGLSLGEIAEHLAISPATARTHAGHALRKLGARNRAHAVALAAESGLLAAAA